MPETFKQIKGTTVAFGDVVQLSKERSNDPERDGFERYLGLEHLKPSDLKVCSWGDIVDGTTFTSVFKPGQVLFGKRRAYQRKVAVADFSGVCSGDIYVLEPKGDELLPELLPFICQSESFYDYVISMSQGGLSPRVNWKALAKYEFLLPPLDEQRRIADAFVAASNLQDACLRSLDSLRRVEMRFILDAFKSALRSAKLYRISDIAELKMGRQKAPKYAKGVGLRSFLSVANVGELELVLGSVEKMDFTDTEFERFRVIPGDILITEGDLIGRFNVGRAAVFKGEILDCCFQNTLIRLRPRKGLDVDYTLLMLEGARLSGVFARAAKTTTVTHLGLGRLSEVTLPFPALPKQLEVGNQLKALIESRTRLRERLSDAARVLSQLSQEVFG